MCALRVQLSRAETDAIGYNLLNALPVKWPFQGISAGCENIETKRPYQCPYLPPAYPWFSFL